MYRLAKVGFSQSYTYFTWRTHKQELTEYFQELTHPPVSEFFRPNVWPNTPDILHETLQTGGRPMFEARFVMAATLAATYGIYGPAFELLEHVPREPGSEEYLNSEKYEIRSLGPGTTRLARSADPRGQPDPPRAPGPPVERAARVPRHRRRRAARLHEANPPMGATPC